MTHVRNVRRAALCGAALLSLTLPSAAQAQDEELGLGLDLTGDTQDLRPTLAVVGVDLAEGNPKRDGWILKYIGTVLSTNASKSNLFAQVLAPEDVAQKLGAKHAEALKCTEDSCMVEIAAELGVERVITAQSSHRPGDSSLKLNAFTRATLSVESATVQVKGPPRGDFFKKTVTALKPLFQSLSGKLARLQVEPSLDTAKVTLGDRELGVGTVDVKVSAGSYLLKAAAEGYAAQKQVALEEGGSADVKLTLEPVKDAPPALALSLDKPSGASGGTPSSGGGARAAPSGPGPFSGFSMDGVLKHPGTYVGAAGAVALIAGAGLGASAMSARGQLVDRDQDGVLDITRSAAYGARSQATIANVLFAAGAVGLVGGGTWLLVSPPKGGGVAVSAGGTF